MKVEFESQSKEIGTPLSEVPFGSVITRPDAPGHAYLVVSAMDGTGNRRLATLASGTLKNPPSDMRVFVHYAKVTVGAIVPAGEVEYRQEIVDCGRCFRQGVIGINKGSRC